MTAGAGLAFGRRQVRVEKQFFADPFNGRQIAVVLDGEQFGRPREGDAQ